jgi:benzoate membrane transport protein
LLVGAPACFVVTVADLPILNIGAAFWGRAASVPVSSLVERRDFTRSA